jgi:hypothetical protein
MDLLLGLSLDLVRGHLRVLAGGHLTRHVLRSLRLLALLRQLLLATCDRGMACLSTLHVPFPSMTSTTEH